MSWYLSSSQRHRVPTPRAAGRQLTFSLRNRYRCSPVIGCQTTVNLIRKIGRSCVQLSLASMCIRRGSDVRLHVQVRGQAGADGRIGECRAHGGALQRDTRRGGGSCGQRSRQEGDGDGSRREAMLLLAPGLAAGLMAVDGRLSVATTGDGRVVHGRQRCRRRREVWAARGRVAAARLAETGRPATDAQLHESIRGRAHWGGWARYKNAGLVNEARVLEDAG